MPPHCALVAGATGVAGGNLVAHLEGRGDWRVIGVSRRMPQGAGESRSISVDLLDRHDTAAKLGRLAEVTHIFFAALQSAPSLAEEVAPNLGMLRHVVETIEAVATRLERVVLLQDASGIDTDRLKFFTQNLQVSGTPIANWKLRIASATSAVP